MKPIEKPYYWKVTPRVHTFFILAGLMGVAFLLSVYEVTNNVWFGYIGAGLVTMFAYKWEYFEQESNY